MCRVSFLSVAILLVIIKTGSCLRCYQCTSTNQQDCKDPFVNANEKVLTRDCLSADSLSFNREYLTTLVGPIVNTHTQNAPSYCHKVVFESGVTFRTCAEGNAANMNYTCQLLENSSRNQPGDIARRLKHCSVCDKDGCNGAGALAASIPLALSALGAYLLYNH